MRDKGCRFGLVWNREESGRSERKRNAKRIYFMNERLFSINRKNSRKAAAFIAIFPRSYLVYFYKWIAFLFSAHMCL